MYSRLVHNTRNMVCVCGGVCVCVVLWVCVCAGVCVLDVFLHVVHVYSTGVSCVLCRAYGGCICVVRVSCCVWVRAFVFCLCVGCVCCVLDASHRYCDTAQTWLVCSERSFCHTHGIWKPLGESITNFRGILFAQSQRDITQHYVQAVIDQKRMLSHNELTKNRKINYSRMLGIP